MRKIYFYRFYIGMVNVLSVDSLRNKPPQAVLFIVTAHIKSNNLKNSSIN